MPMIWGHKALEGTRRVRAGFGLSSSIAQRSPRVSGLVFSSNSNSSCGYKDSIVEQTVFSSNSNSSCGYKDSVVRRTNHEQTLELQQRLYSLGKPLLQDSVAAGSRLRA